MPGGGASTARCAERGRRAGLHLPPGPARTPPEEPALPRTPQPGTDEALLAAVLTALAGVRRGDRVAGVGTGPRTSAALLAMAGADGFADTAARVVVAGSAHDVRLALARLAPGGRLVSVAADADAARRTAAACALDLRHVEPVGHLVAWSAVLPAVPREQLLAEQPGAGER